MIWVFHDVIHIVKHLTSVVSLFTLKQHHVHVRCDEETFISFNVMA